jgi:quinol monooxygenase YgiN
MTMQRVTLVRYTAKPEHAEENERLARAVFAELRARAPKHLMYSLFRNGADFVHLLVNSETEDSTGVTDLPSFKAYVKDIEARCVAPPEQTRLGVHLLESWGLESAAR